MSKAPGAIERVKSAIIYRNRGQLSDALAEIEKAYGHYPAVNNQTAKMRERASHAARLSAESAINRLWSEVSSELNRLESILDFRDQAKE